MDILRTLATDARSARAIQNQNLKMSNFSNAEFDQYANLSHQMGGRQLSAKDDVLLTDFVQKSNGLRPNGLLLAGGEKLSSGPVPMSDQTLPIMLQEWNCITDHCSDFIFSKVDVCKSTYKWRKFDTIDPYVLQADLAGCHAGLNEINIPDGEFHRGELKAYGLAYWMCGDDEKEFACGCDGLENFSAVANWGRYLASKLLTAQEVRRYFKIHDTLAAREDGLGCLDLSLPIPNDPLDPLFPAKLGVEGTWQADNFCHPFADSFLEFLNIIKNCKCEDFNRMVIGEDVYRWLKTRIRFNALYNGAENRSNATLDYIASRLDLDAVCVSKTKVAVPELDDAGAPTGKKLIKKLWAGSILMFESNINFGTTDCPDSTFAMAAGRPEEKLVTRVLRDPLKGNSLTPGSVRLSVATRTGDEIVDTYKACMLKNSLSDFCKKMIESMIPKQGDGVKARAARAKKSDEIANKLNA